MPLRRPVCLHPIQDARHPNSALVHKGFDHKCYQSMTRSQLESLLGPSEWKQNDLNCNFYWIATGSCGNGWNAIEIVFEKEKVEKWREIWDDFGERNHNKQGR